MSEGEWVDGLERRFGFLAAPGLPTFVAGMTAAVGILGQLKPEFVDALRLDTEALGRGQLWRALTFVVVPPPAGALWLILWILLLYACLNALDVAWGDFKFTVYLGVGVAATVVGAFLVGRLAAASGFGGVEFGNSEVLLAAFLAFARLMPDREILVMFVLPVKLRWLAGLAALWTALQFVGAGLGGRVEIAAGLLPYFLFFGPGHWRDARWTWRRWREGRSG
jgi:hypothetical protein